MAGVDIDLFCPLSYCGTKYLRQIPIDCLILHVHLDWLSTVPSESLRRFSFDTCTQTMEPTIIFMVGVLSLVGRLGGYPKKCHLK